MQPCRSFERRRRSVARAGSYEISSLVKAIVWLNMKLGLTGDDKQDSQQGLLINLRFLLDYRNLFWIVVFILYKVMW